MAARTAKQLARTDSAPIERMDAGVMENAITGMGDPQYDKSMHTRVSIHRKRLQQAEVETLYWGSWLCRESINAYPFEGTREWTEIKLGGKSQDTRKIENFDTYQNKLGVKQAICKADAWARLYGGAAIVMVIEDGQAFDKPVRPDRIRRVRSLHVLDRYEILPYLVNADAANPEFYQLVMTPEKAMEFQRALGQANVPKTGALIHKTRVLRFDGVEMPPNVLRRFDGWGASILDAMYSDFSRYESLSNGITNLVDEASIFIYAMKDLHKLLSAADEKSLAILQNRLRAMRLTKGNLKALILDADKESAQFATRNFAGLPELMEKLLVPLVGASRVPVTILLGRGPLGLAAQGTGDTEERAWTKLVNQYQNQKYAPMLRSPSGEAGLFDFIWLAQDGPSKGKMPDEWTLGFRSLHEMSDKEKAELRASQSGTDRAYMDMGVLLKEEIRTSRFEGAEYSLETQLNQELWDEQQRKAEEEADAFDQFNDYGMGGEFEGGGQFGQLPPAQQNGNGNGQPVGAAPAEKTDSADRIKYVLKWQGLNIGVSHEPGDIRNGKYPMYALYGHIRGSYGAAEDGMAIDIYLGPNPESNLLFKVRQNNEDGSLDESKLIGGCDSIAEARQLYLKHYPSTFFGGIDPVKWQELAAYRMDEGTIGAFAGELKDVEGDVDREAGARPVKKNAKLGKWAAYLSKRSGSSEVITNCENFTDRFDAWQTYREDAPRKSRKKSPKERGLVKKEIVNSQGEKQTVWVKPETVAKVAGGIAVAGLGAAALAAGAIALSKRNEGSSSSQISIAAPVPAPAPSYVPEKQTGSPSEKSGRGKLIAGLGAGALVVGGAIAAGSASRRENPVQPVSPVQPAPEVPPLQVSKPSKVYKPKKVLSDQEWENVVMQTPEGELRSVTPKPKKAEILTYNDGEDGYGYYQLTAGDEPLEENSEQAGWIMKSISKGNGQGLIIERRGNEIGVAIERVPVSDDRLDIRGRQPKETFAFTFDASQEIEVRAIAHSYLSGNLNLAQLTNQVREDKSQGKVYANLDNILPLLTSTVRDTQTSAVEGVWQKQHEEQKWGTPNELEAIYNSPNEEKRRQIQLLAKELQDFALPEGDGMLVAVSDTRMHRMPEGVNRQLTGVQGLKAAIAPSATNEPDTPATKPTAPAQKPVTPEPPLPTPQVESVQQQPTEIQPEREPPQPVAPEPITPEPEPEVVETASSYLPIPKNTNARRFYEKTNKKLARFGDLDEEDFSQESLDNIARGGSIFGLIPDGLMDNADDEIEDEAEREAAKSYIKEFFKRQERKIFAAVIAKELEIPDPSDTDAVMEFIKRGTRSSNQTMPAYNEAQWKPSMSQAEAEQWMSGSAWNELAYHGTDERGLSGIGQSGFDLDRRSTGRLFGDAIYLGCTPDTVSKFAQRADKPAIGSFAVNVKNVFDVDSLNMKVAAEPEGTEFRAMAEKMGLADRFDEIAKDEASRRAAAQLVFDPLAKGDIPDEQLRAKLEQDPLSVLYSYVVYKYRAQEDWTQKRQTYAQVFNRLLQEQGYDAIYIPNLDYLMVFNTKNVVLINE